MRIFNRPWDTCSNIVSAHRGATDGELVLLARSGDVILLRPLDVLAMAEYFNMNVREADRVSPYAVHAYDMPTTSPSSIPDHAVSTNAFREFEQYMRVANPPHVDTHEDPAPPQTPDWHPLDAFSGCVRPSTPVSRFSIGEFAWRTPGEVHDPAGEDTSDE